MSKQSSKFAIPLTREDNAFFGRLQRARARYALRCPAISLEAAAYEATAFVEEFKAAIAVGDLEVMEPNIITRELASGIPPEEFVDGPVFWPGTVKA